MASHSGVRLTRRSMAAVLSQHRRRDKSRSKRPNGKGFFQERLTFDAAGQCTAVSKSYFGPLPP
jgi:hypothetical protein